MRDQDDRTVSEREQQLCADPDDRAAYQVYADLLQARGDPLGALIALHAEIDRLDALQGDADRLIRAHHEHLLGVAELPARVSLTWQRGFVHAVTCRLTVPGDVAVALSFLTGLFQRRAGLLVRELCIGLQPPGFRAPVHQPIIDELIRSRRPATLERLIIGCAPALLDHSPDPEFPQRVSLGRVDGLLDAFPRLDTLALHGADHDGSIALAEVSHARLRHLALAGWTGSRALCNEIASSALLPQLATLALTGGSVTESGARVLLAQRQRFGHLERFDLRRNPLSDQTIAALQGLGSAVELGIPTLDFEDPFHCSFCGLERSQVDKLISGPRVFICNQCVALCNDILFADAWGED